MSRSNPSSPVEEGSPGSSPHKKKHLNSRYVFVFRVPPSTQKQDISTEGSPKKDKKKKKGLRTPSFLKKKKEKKKETA